MNLNQVTLPVNDIDKANEFYLTLGFTQIVKSPHYSRFSCPEGDNTFSLMLEEKEYCNGTVIYFEHKLLDQWVEELTGKGVIFEQPPKVESYLWREAICFDPSGNKIKLYWAGENRLNPPWKVKIQQQTGD